MNVGRGMLQVLIRCLLGHLVVEARLLHAEFVALDDLWPSGGLIKAVGNELSLEL